VLDFVDRKAFPNADDKWTWMDHAMMKQLYEREEIITDDNLGHEFQ
jgi:hypothetical protein